MDLLYVACHIIKCNMQTGRNQIFPVVCKYVVGKFQHWDNGELDPRYGGACLKAENARGKIGFQNFPGEQFQPSFTSILLLLIAISRVLHNMEVTLARFGYFFSRFIDLSWVWFQGKESGNRCDRSNLVRWPIGKLRSTVVQKIHLRQSWWL